MFIMVILTYFMHMTSGHDLVCVLVVSDIKFYKYCVNKDLCKFTILCQGDLYCDIFWGCMICQQRFLKVVI